MTFVRITPLNRPVEPPFKSKEYSQADKDAEARYLAERKALRAEFMKTWVPPFPPEDSDDPGNPRYFEASTVEVAAFECWLLQREGKVAVPTRPYWENRVEDGWLTSCDDDNTGILEREPTAASITLPFLMEGGEFSLTFESQKYQDDHLGPIRIKTRIRSDKRLRVKTEHGVYFGQVKSDCWDMTVDYIILPNGTPQDVTDRVAAAYGKIIQLRLPDDYPAVMPLRENCQFCGRPFTDQVSKVIGIGPTCSARLGLPHSPDAANRILQRRRELLGSENPTHMMNV